MITMKFCFLYYLLYIIRFSLSDDVSTPHQCVAPPSEKCFTVIVDQKLTWNNAEAYCEKNLPNGRLASIHNAFEGGIIAAWLPFLSSDPWIGAFKVGSLPFQWTDASALDYTNWAPGQPTDRCAQVCHSTETNAGIQCQQGKWLSTDCETSVSQFICDYGNFSTASATTTSAPLTVVEHYCNSEINKCFALVIGEAEWTEAETFCSTLVQNETVATLASITSKADADIIATMLQYPNLKSNLWIGAFAFGDSPYSWTDGSLFLFENWAPGQPPSYHDGCVQVCLANDSSCIQGKWTVKPCTQRQSFVCIDCFDIQQKFHNIKSGVYLQKPPGVQPFYAFCDMETDGGGWTVFQRRIDNSIPFYDKTSNEYKIGFSNGLNNNLWLGNDNIHVLSTKDSNVELRIDIWGDRAPGSSQVNGYWFGKYTFSIDNEASNYRLYVSSSSTGNASSTGNGISHNSGLDFSTVSTNICTEYQWGGWWTNSKCQGTLSLNGKYEPSQWHNWYGFSWHTGSYFINPAQSRMMLRKTL